MKYSYMVLEEWNSNCRIIGDENRRPIAARKSIESAGFTSTIISSNFLENFPEYFSHKRSLALTRRTLTLGELGCARSHLDVYVNFLDSKEDLCIVLEDDVSLIPGCIYEFRQSLREISRIQRKSPWVPRVFSFYSESAIVSPDAFEDSNFHFVYGYPSHAAAYVINREAATSLLRTNSELDFQADWPKGNVVKFYLYNSKFFLHPEDKKGGHSLLEIDRKKAQHKSIYKIFLALKTLTFVTYFREKMYFKSSKQYLSDFVLPILDWQILRIGSDSFAPWSSGVRVVSRKNFYRYWRH